MTKTSIYHFLCGPLGQEVSVAQVVDFDVLDVVAIRNVHVAVDLVRGSCRARAAARGGLGSDWRDVDMLDALARLELSIDLGRGGSYGCVSMLARLIRKTQPGTINLPEPHLRQLLGLLETSRGMRQCLGPWTMGSCREPSRPCEPRETENAGRIWKPFEVRAPFGRSGIAWRFFVRSHPWWATGLTATMWVADAALEGKWS